MCAKCPCASMARRRRAHWRSERRVGGHLGHRFHPECSGTTWCSGALGGRERLESDAAHSWCNRDGASEHEADVGTRLSALCVEPLSRTRGANEKSAEIVMLLASGARPLVVDGPTGCVLLPLRRALSVVMERRFDGWTLGSWVPGGGKPSHVESVAFGPSEGNISSAHPVSSEMRAICVCGRVFLCNVRVHA